jgi:hypothetical protein
MRLFGSLAFCFILSLAACGSDDERWDGVHYPVWLVPDSLRGVQSCDAVDPECPDGTFCAVLRLQDGDSEPLCVEQAFCDFVTCDDGRECVVAESSPAQIFCSGTSATEDGDDPVHS